MKHRFLKDMQYICLSVLENQFGKMKNPGMEILIK